MHHSEPRHNRILGQDHNKDPNSHPSQQNLYFQMGRMGRELNIAF